MTPSAPAASAKTAPNPTAKAAYQSAPQAGPSDDPELARFERYPINPADFRSGADEPLTLAEAAEYLGCSYEHARTLAARGVYAPLPDGSDGGQHPGDRRIGLATYRLGTRSRRTSRLAVRWLYRQLNPTRVPSGELAGPYTSAEAVIERLGFPRTP